MKEISDDSMDRRVEQIHRVLSLHRRTYATFKSLAALKTLLSTLQSSCNEVIANKRRLTIFADLNYKPVAGDEVDQMFAETLSRLGF